MRILKEYSALANPVKLTNDNSLSLELQSENITLALEYIERQTYGTEISDVTLSAVKTATVEVFEILSKCAEKSSNLGSEIAISCSFHSYYYMLIFEFSESALPLHTLNKSVKLLNSTDLGDEIGFINIVHFVNRIALSVDKITEKMRISIIKEKRYSVPEIINESSPLLAPFSVGDETLAEDFSKRLYAQAGLSADKFLISPGLFIGNLEEGELECVFLRDYAGNCAGGAVWQKTYGIIVLMSFAVFAVQDNFKTVKTMLLKEFEDAAARSDASFIVSKIKDSNIINEYFDFQDEKYNYKSLSAQKRQTSYIKPELMPLIKKAYKNFEMNREIREINYNYTFIEPHSVLTTKIDTASSEAVLSILWFGDDLKSNIIRHIIALCKIGIENIYFRLDLGIPEEAAVSDLVQSCGFEPEYLWPYSSDKGDIVVFTYYKSSAFEIKSCVISPIDKSNIDKTPALVRKVYGENYPSQYLYEPEKLREKIRKRHIYSFIATDDKKNAIGMISLVKLSDNPYLFEIGQLMVDPAHRGTNVVNQLIEYIYTSAIRTLDFDAVISESVTFHKLSQRSCINSGFCDVALKLNIMSANAFNLESERRQVGRMSCVVSCIERADETFKVYLPPRYAQSIQFCFEGLKSRCYKTATETPISAITEYHINDDEANTSKVLNITFNSIGEDIAEAIEKIESYACELKIMSMLVNIPLANPGNAAAVEIFKSRGFIFGGVMPYWLPESDSLLMQKLYGNIPDWDNIKLFSRKIKEIAKIIKKDMES